MRQRTINSIGNFIKSELMGFFDNDNIISIGISKKIVNEDITDIDSVTVSVNKKLPKSKLRAHEIFPSTFDIAGVELKSDVVELKPIQGSTPGKVAVGKDNPRTQRLRKIQPGISIGSGSIGLTGTLSAIVYKEQKPFLLSNYHILGPEKSKVSQPGKLDRDNSPGESYIGEVMYASASLDCSLASILTREYTNRVFGFEEDVFITDCKDVKIDDEVVKSGRGSKITYGIVDQIKSVVKVNGNFLTDQFRVKINPNYYPPFGEIAIRNDSGSPWLFLKYGKVTNSLLGITTSGDGSEIDNNPSNEYSYATEMKSIIKEFNLSLNPYN